jgi:tellurite methyltransferase
LFLAEQGWHVTAVDGSAVALEKLRENALRRGMSIQEAQAWEDHQDREVRTITLLQMDLAAATLPVSRFSLVLNVSYLQRSLFPQIECALLPGGVVLFETYTTEQLVFEGGPRNPEFLLAPGELRTAFPGCETLFYRELKAQRGIATLLARKPVISPHGASERA